MDSNTSLDVIQFKWKAITSLLIIILTFILVGAISLFSKSQSKESIIAIVAMGFGNIITTILIFFRTPPKTSKLWKEFAVGVGAQFVGGFFLMLLANYLSK